MAEANAGASDALKMAAYKTTRYSVIDGVHCSAEIGTHPFVPGRDVDDPDHPDDRWCNTCGEAVADV